MAQGYDTSRFRDNIDQSFTCPICFGVLKDPMQCEKNEHYFCCCCIKQHLEKTSLTCPVCNDKLTLETLRKAPRMIADLISRLKISCDHAARGCEAVVELGALQSHLQECDFMPVACSNDGCIELVSKRDLRHHELELCRFKTTSYDEKMPRRKYDLHGCTLRREMDEMKRGLAEGMQRMTIAIENLEKSSRNVSNKINSMNTDIVIIAGHNPETNSILSSVERFNLFNQTWARLPALKQARLDAATVLLGSQILVCGGRFSTSLDPTDKNDPTDSIEVMDMNNPTEWKDFAVNLPIKVFGHKCAVYGNHLLIFGGVTTGWKYLNTIHELLLVPPYSSKLLCHMKKKRAFHGLEVFDGDKVLVAGGFRAETDVELFDTTRNDSVEMPPLPSPLRSIATVRRGDTMLLIGGRDKEQKPSSEIIEYDFKTGQSQVRLAMTTERYACSAVYHRNTLVILGGWGAVKEVDCFNFSSNSWTKLASLNEGRADASAVIVNRNNYEF